ncbi:hypothetical protein [Anderseniella sp. Alg231-50]|uniref:hypothetical protein n=1 Tax=Anderseniella sp. Alg231-50 TaxID=1922226 RepID=UPI000D55C867
MTQFIASIIGPYLLVTGLGMVLSRRFYLRMMSGNDSADPILLNLSGAVHFVLGMIVLRNHFLWNNLEAALVSLFGVLLVLKGVVLIAVPERAVQTTEKIGNTLSVSTAGFLIVGLYFCYIGYR